MLVVNDRGHYYLQMIFNLIKRFSSWLDHKIWRWELRKRIKRNDKKYKAD